MAGKPFLPRTVYIVLACLCLCVLSTKVHAANEYKNSTHGNTTYGVSRPDMVTAGYSRGNCAHCHEQHASFGGIEPAPATGPKGFLLFDAANTSQTTNFCFDCHGTGTAYQTGGHVTNRSYSYRAGNWSADTLSNIKDAFAQSSAHNLADIVTFAAGKAWNFSTGSNACAVCHNPHVVGGDPANAPALAKSAGTRGWPVTRASQGKTTWPANLWGDGAGEKMSNYTARYQAPYRFGSAAAYEPDGSVTQNGSNLSDFNTFCTDCHNSTNTIYSTNLARNLRTIDWNNEKHGQGNADVWIDVLAPYSSGAGGLGYVLSCLDCHEPHGSTNIFLLRREVNGAVLSGAVSTTPNLSRLCERCHSNGWQAMHHSNNDRAYSLSMCGACHGGYPQDCGRCHYHGAISGSGGIQSCAYAPAARRTF